MARTKLPYKEGDWFAVPLRSGGYGLGLVARMDGTGVVLGYFFGPKRQGLPTKDDTIGLSAGDAVLTRRIGDLGLLRGEWPIVYRPDAWNREEWPLLAFARIVVDRSRAWRVEYAPDDIGKVIRLTSVNVSEVEHLPEDGLSGYGALEIRLSQLLDPG